MFVYILFITVVFFIPNDPEVHVNVKAVGSYDTQEECDVEEKRITLDMQKSYPGATDYQVRCEKREKPKNKPFSERIF